MRRVAVLLAVLLVVLLVGVPAYAADGEGGGFSLWDLISAIGDFFKNLLEGIIEGLKFLFIPGDDFFPRVQEELREKLAQKFGGLKSMLTFLQETFTDLRRYKDTDDMLVVKFPQDHILSNAKIDLLLNAKGFLGFVRGASSGFVVLVTAMFLRKKLLEMVNT